MHGERTLAYELLLIDLFPEIGHLLASNGLIATGPHCTVPIADRAYAGVFSEADS